METITLLDNVQAMDTMFTMRDVIYIVGLLFSGVGAWFALKAQITKVKTDKELAVAALKNEIGGLKSAKESAEKEYKEAIMNAKNGRNAIRKEFTEQIEKREQILHQRIDRVRDDNLKSYEKLETRIEALDRKYDTGTQQILNAINAKK
jgi:hypothetical protein